MKASDSKKQDFRRQRAYLDTLSINQVHLRNPWVVAWWSAAFPGFGHIMLCKYFVGAVLILWEHVINVKSRLNEAIVYSMVGDFGQAEATLDPQWLLLYIPPYIFGIWDSYRRTNEMNRHFMLAYREKSYIQPFTLSSVEVNYLDRRSPVLSLVWTAIMPGLGYMYINRIPSALTILASWLVSLYYSNFLVAIIPLLKGEFHQATAAISKQWLLFLPSIYGFAMYDTYVATVENNKLFNVEQKLYFARSYQDRRFPMPLPPRSVHPEEPKPCI